MSVLEPIFLGDKLKRIVDILLSGIGIVFLLPVFAVVALGVKMTSPGPIFFRQERMGLSGSTFRIFKFRTMKVQKPNSGCQVTANGDSRITPFGAFLRQYKLDELPQLLNVIIGDMALVGPRPEVPEFADLFPAEYKRILQVRPGITHPATLYFRREEEILATAHDPREFYIHKLLPEKLAAYESNLEQSLTRDIQTIVETILPHGTTKAYGPEHFAPVRALGIVPFPTTMVENVPAFSDSAYDTCESASGISVPAEAMEAKVANGTNFGR